MEQTKGKISVENFKAFFAIRIAHNYIGVELGYDVVRNGFLQCLQMFTILMSMLIRDV